MMDITNMQFRAMSDRALLSLMGSFVKHHRLEQNKTQEQLAQEAGINRTTLSQFEQGKHAILLTLIQILRALDKLNVLEGFKVEQQISPLQMSKIVQNKRKRASAQKQSDSPQESEW